MFIKKKILATCSAALLVVGLAACSNDNKTEPTPSVAPTLSATPPPTLPDGTKAENPIPSGPDELATGGVNAPKGRPDVNATDFKPAAYKKDTVNYLYGVGAQAIVAADGVYADVAIHKPELATTDYHSLAEIAVQSADRDQIVEIGWTVDRVVNNGSAEPHLFAYHWVNGAPSGCYNGCGFVNYGGATLRAGMQLTNGTTKQMGIQHFNNAWWLSYDRKWVGYFPDALWTGATLSVTFNSAELTQLFGEVASTVTNPCTDMGNGLPASNAGAAKFSSVTYVEGPTVNILTRVVPNTTTIYSVANNSKRTFSYGGAGNGAC